MYFQVSKGIVVMMKRIRGMKAQSFMLIPKASFHEGNQSAFVRNPSDDNSDDINQPNLMIPTIDLNSTKPFSLILPRTTDSLCGTKMKKKNLQSSCATLAPGMVLMKNYVSISDQVDIVNTCHEFGMGRGGFYKPGYKDFYMMCFGRNWDPKTKYDARCRSDGSQAPPIPDHLVSLVETSIQDSQSYDKIPSMYPDICIVNFYLTNGRLGLHKDRDESPDSLNRGLPVVSISVGDSAQFVYGRHKDEKKTSEVLLNSGDVLIFGGKSRHIYHGVKAIIPNSAPLPLLQQSMLRPGRLNLTFRQF